MVELLGMGVSSPCTQKGQSWVESGLYLTVRSPR